MQENMTATSQEGFITFDAACSYLGVTRGMMYQYTHQKLFPYYKPFGKKLYFKKSELDAIIGSVRVASQSELAEQAHQMTRRPAAV